MLLFLRVLLHLLLHALLPLLPGELLHLVLDLQRVAASGHRLTLPKSWARDTEE